MMYVTASGSVVFEVDRKQAFREVEDALDTVRGS